MKQRLLFTLICCLSVFTAVAQGGAPWEDAKGKGTLVSPWLIESPDHWNVLADSVNNNGSDFAGKYFALAADLGTSSTSCEL